MSSSNIRMARSTSVARLARATSAVESGFIAAGVTISAIACVQSLVVLLRWAFFGA